MYIHINLKINKKTKNKCETIKKTYSTSFSQNSQSLIIPDSENKNMMADRTNHLTSHDEDDEGHRQKADGEEEAERHRGLI